MNIIKRYMLLISLVFSFCVASGLGPVASAQISSGAKEQACKGANLSNNDGNCKSDKATSRIDSAVKNALNLLTTIVGIIAVIVIIVNGLRFITANGDSGQISNARNGIIYAILGLAVVALAQVIVRFVLSRI